MPLEGKRWLPRDIAKLLWDAGWLNAQNLAIMVAVTLAESAGFEEAWNLNADGSHDWGLFQLNDQKKTGQALEDFKAKALDPAQAVLIARELYDNRQFQPWAAYKNQSYKQFLPSGCYAVMNMLREEFGLQAI